MQNLRNIEEFDDIDTSFAGFDARDLGLRCLQAARKLVLRELR